MFCIRAEQINDSYVFREDSMSQLLQLSQHIVQSKGNWQTFSDMQWFWESSFQVPLNVLFQQKWMGELWQKDWCRDFPSCPLVKNLPCSAGDIGSIPGKQTKIPHAIEQLSLCSTNRVCTPQREMLHDGPKFPYATTKTWYSQTNTFLKKILVLLL